MLRTGVIWKSGWCCCCISNRSGWLLELLTELTNGTKETLGLRDTQPKGIAFLSCEDNMLAIMANTKRLFTQVVSSISYTMQQSTRIVCNISYSGSHHCLSSTSRARPCESQPSNPAHRIPFSKFHNLHAKKSDETKHAKQLTLTQNNITVLKDGAFWGLSKVRILQTLTLQSQANDIAQNLTLWQSLCLSLIPIMI